MMQNNFSNDEFVNPSKVLKTLPLKANMVACDLGCGSGGWAIPLAKILNRGMVYAVDILEESLSALKGKVEAEQIINISTILSDIERGVKIEDKELDLILLTNILYQIQDRENLIKECRRLLKIRGLLLIVDYKKEATFGPKEGRLIPEEIIPLLEKLGFREEQRFDAGKYHWALLLSK